MPEIVTFETLRGLTLASIEGLEKGSEVVTFVTTCGRTFRMWYEQDCCASCSVEDITGDVADLIGSPIVMADEVESAQGDPAPEGCLDLTDSWTWTFYKLATIKGYVTIRWFGESNGYYSESVSFDEVRS